jgi:hypothetical protein
MDGRKEGRKKERVSLSYTTETSSETDPTVHSLIFGWAGLVVGGGGEAGYLSFRAQKNGQLSTEERSEMTEAGFLVSGFILNCYVSIMGISLQAQRYKKKKKKNMMTELADAPRGKPLVVFHSSHDWKR